MGLSSWLAHNRPLTKSSHSCPLVYICVLLSSYKSTCHGLGPTLVASFSPGFLFVLFCFKDHFSKYCHTEVRNPTYEFWGDTIQPIRVAVTADI